MKRHLITLEQHEMALKKGIDVPNQEPLFPIGLDQVGITNKQVWIHVPSGHLTFDCSIVVDLPACRRGIHMSRMEEAISALHHREFGDVSEYGVELARRVLDKQDGTRVQIEISGAVPVETVTRVSKRVSIDKIDMAARVVLDKGQHDPKVMRRAAIYHITACPCTQVYADNLFDDGSGMLPTVTHSQRSRTSLGIEAYENVSFEQIVACLKRGLHATQDLLKRPDEAEMVLQAHQSPQFAEDAVRAVAREAGISFGKAMPLDTHIEIESLSYESIHIHDVKCCLRTTLGDILDIINRYNK